MSPSTIQQAFDLALQHHQAQRLEDAEQLYRQILAQHPAHADATHLLGVLAHQTGRNEIAVDLIRRAVAIQPNFPEAYNNLGSVLDALGKRAEAIAAYRQAISLRSGYAEAYNNLSVDLRETGQIDQALAASSEAIALRPDLAQTHYNLGDALKDKRLFAEAAAAFEKTIALKPDWTHAHNKLGNARMNNGQLTLAAIAYRQAIALNPAFAEAHYNLGTALKDDGQLGEAATAFRRAIALKPDYFEAHNNLGIVLNTMGCLDEAIAAYRAAIALKPDAALSHLNLGLALLLKGDFQEGWEEHEWRWKWNDFPSSKGRFTQPLWNGSPLQGRTLLIHAEQGFGDTLQFIRYLPLVAQKGGRIVVECQPELLHLLRSLAGTIATECQIIARGEPLPDFDLHCPLLSLPCIFKTTLQSIPTQVPYLFPDPSELEFWRRRLSSDRSQMKIGVSWAGNPGHTRDQTRSISLERLAPLAKVRGAKFYSLQKGLAAAEATSPPPGFDLTDWSAEFHNFSNAAGLIANLDLVISVDTSVAHLAGALDRPTWVLLSYVPDWRWLLDRADSPWYPSVRLFRQSSLGDWTGAIQQMAKALETKTACSVTRSRLESRARRVLPE